VPRAIFFAICRHVCHNPSRQFRLAGLPATARRVVRGGSWNNDQVNARAAYRNNNAPDNRNTNLGLRVVRSSHILIPLRAQPGGCLCIRLSRACSPARLARAVLPVLAPDYGWWPEAKAIKMAQVSPARTGSARQARRAYTEERRLLGPGLETPHVVFIHPPTKRPSSATMVLTCWYCPSFSQCQRCARRR
jgi:Sulfatase-modifying factor enzyme 1